MTFLKSFLCCIAFLFAMPSMADSTVYLGAVSKHIGGDSEYDYNENHNLIGVEADGWFAGFFENSYREDTWAIGHRLTKRYGDFEPGILVGASYGYRNCAKGYDDAGETRRVCPVVAPSLTWHGIKKATGLKPTVMLLGNAVAVTVGVDLETVGGWL